MATSHADADLVLKLYDLRREQTMREARSWYRQEFNPETPGDVAGVLGGSKSAFFRMVVSYWDMAAALVNHGVIDESLFNDVNVEHVGTFAKVEPFLGELRSATGNPDFLAHLEQLVMRLPDAKGRLAAVRAQSRRGQASSSLATHTPSPTTDDAPDRWAER